MQCVKFWTRCLCLTLLMATGCNSKTTTDGGTATTEKDGSKARKTLIPVKKDVKDLIGNWVIVVTNQGTDNYRWIIQFSKNVDGKIAGEFVDSSQDKKDVSEFVSSQDNESSKTRVDSVDVHGDDIRIVIKNARGAIDFSGKFQGGFIRGNIRSSPAEVLMTRLLPTDEKSLEKYGLTGRPPAADIFEALVKGKELKPDEFFSTICEHQSSPLAQDMFGMMLNSHVQNNFDDARMNEIVNAYLSAAKIWGVRWEARTELSIGANLATGRRFPLLALKHLDASLEKLGEDRDALAPRVVNFRDAAMTTKKIQEISSAHSTDEERASACAGLKELFKSQKYNPEILMALAVYAEKMGQVDEAIEYLSDIVALPMLEAMIMQLRMGSPPDTPTPTEALKKILEQKQGNSNGFNDLVKSAYQRKIAAFLDEIKAKAPAIPAAEVGNKTVLVEEFTGMLSPYAVAADLAMVGLGQSYPTSKVIVLRFHQHLPKPDGLTNQDSEERAASYEIRQSPTIVLDGRVVNPQIYSGPMQMTENGFLFLRQLIDPLLSEKTDIAIQLSAVADDGQLKITAEVTGVPAEILDTCRLRLAIVENHVDMYAASATNGIRDREFVVRDMPGGAKGLPPKKGELKYSTEISIAELEQRVVNYIAKYEAGRRGEFPAELKPPIRGPISVVAWVQNGHLDEVSKSKLVLQSVLVPVTGDTSPESATKSEPIVKPIPEVPARESVGPENTPLTPAATATNEAPGESTPPPPSLPE